MRSKYGDFRCCCEATFCGTTLYEALTAQGVDCAITAPDSMPRRGGDLIKTDRRDARTLAEYFAAGFLTECFILNSELRPVRSLMRGRATLIEDIHRSKMQAIHFIACLWTLLQCRKLLGAKVYGPDQYTAIL